MGLALSDDERCSSGCQAEKFKKPLAIPSRSKEHSLAPRLLGVSEHPEQPVHKGGGDLIQKGKAVGAVAYFTCFESNSFFAIF